MGSLRTLRTRTSSEISEAVILLQPEERSEEFQYKDKEEFLEILEKILSNYNRVLEIVSFN
jgi:hypothetical protein